MSLEEGDSRITLTGEYLHGEYNNFTFWDDFVNSVLMGDCFEGEMLDERPCPSENFTMALNEESKWNMDMSLESDSYSIDLEDDGFVIVDGEAHWD